jgi:hypothetical protein
MRTSNADIQIAKSCLAANGGNADGVDGSCTIGVVMRHTAEHYRSPLVALTIAALKYLSG